MAINNSQNFAFGTELAATMTGAFLFIGKLIQNPFLILYQILKYNFQYFYKFETYIFQY